MIFRILSISIFFGVFSLFVHGGKIRIPDSEISPKVEMTKVNLLESLRSMQCKKKFIPLRRDFDLHTENFIRSISTKLVKTKEENFTSTLDTPEFYTTLKTKFFLDTVYFDPFSPKHRDLKKSIIDLVYYIILLLKDNWKEAYTTLTFCCLF